MRLGIFPSRRVGPAHQRASSPADTPSPDKKSGSASARPKAARAGPRIGLIALITVAVLATAAGAWLIAGRFATTTPTGSAELGGLITTPQRAGWVPMEAHHMDQQGGYQMPTQMMPGAPEGDDMRLGVPLTLVNTSDEVRRFDVLDEFTLTGGRTSAPVRLHSDTFGLLARLNPGSAVNGVLYFDTTVPGAGDPPLLLQWHRDGRTVYLSVPMTDGAPAPHPDHGP